MPEGLPRAGATRMAPPDGALYACSDVSDLTGDSLAFTGEIMEKAGDAVTPGLDFDPMRGRQTMRLYYGGATMDIAGGLSRLAGFMAVR